MDSGVEARELLVELHVGRLDRETSAPRHRIASVHDEVQDCLLDLPGVRLGPPELALERGGQLHVLADHTPEHPLHAGDDRVQVEDTRLEDLPAAECEQLLRQRRSAAAGLPDLLGAFAPRVAFGQLGEQQLAVARDGRQQVVEIVRDAAGQPAHGLHLLRLQELLLEPTAFGHVEYGAEQDLLAILVGDERDVFHDPDEAAILAARLVLVVDEAALAAQAFEELLSRPPVGVVCGPGLRHGLGRRCEAHNLRERAVALEQAAVRGRPVDPREVALEEEAIALLGPADLRLHAFAPRDVAQDRL